MIRALHVLSGLTILLAGGVWVLCAVQWVQEEPQRDPLLTQPGAVEALARGTQTTPVEERERLSPLLAAASTFAAHLSPPAPPKASPVVQEAPKPVTPVVRPPAASVKFKLCGTSCCDDRPERSMALILEPGNNNPARWVKSGTQVGHVSIEEIRPGSVTYREGERVQEMALERQTGTTTVATDGEGSHSPGPAVAAKIETGRLPTSTRRPTPSKGMTVGSARTAALD